MKSEPNRSKPEPKADPMFMFISAKGLAVLGNEWLLEKKELFWPAAE